MPAEGFVNLNVQGDAAFQLSLPSYAYDAKPLLEAQSFQLLKNKWTSILGTSGCGKTTLLRMIAGLLPKHSILPQNIIAYLPQSELLLPWASAFNNILIGPKLRGEYRKFHPKALKILEMIGLRDYAHYFPHQLSGGMKQRVQLARILIEDAEIILLDEPFSALDALTRIEINQLAKFYLKEKTVLLVTHDPMEALRLSDEIHILKNKPAKLEKAFSVSDNTRSDPNTLSILYQKLGIAL